MSSLVFTTPCGFRIALATRDDADKSLIIKTYFNGGEVNLNVDGYALSKEGALLLADKIKVLYAGA